MTNIKKIMLILPMILLIIFISFQVKAIGISPGRTTINFESGLEKEITFKVINNEYKDMEVRFFVEGELSNFIILKEEKAQFSSSEEVKVFKYKVKLPKKIKEPGYKTAKIIAVDITGEHATIGAKAGVATELRIFVPYPGKFAKSEIEIDTSNPKKIKFITSVFNLGTETINNIKEVIDIYRGNTKVDSLVLEGENLKTTKRISLIKIWNNTEGIGNYKAVITITYDEKKEILEKEFSIGILQLEIKNVYVKNFKLGDIAKFSILLENLWNKEIKGVYAELKIYTKTGDLIGNIKSSSEDIPAKDKKVLFAYWDTEEIQEGDYKGELVVNYENKKIKKQLSIKVRMNSIDVTSLGEVTAAAISKEKKKGKWTSLIVMFLIILIIINLAWFLYFKRLRFASKSKKKRKS